MLGLPLHPLVVHLVVILVPLASLAFLLTDWREEWRRRYAGIVAVLALAAALASVVAAESGSELKSTVLRAAAEEGVSARFGEHPDYGRATEIAALALAAGAVLAWAGTTPRLRSRLPRLWNMTAHMLAALPATAALVAVSLAGHSGALLVWRELGTYPPGKIAALRDQGQDTPPAPAPELPAGAIAVRLLEFRFEPVTIEVSSGAEVVLHAINAGKVFHTLTVLEPRADTRPLWPATSATLSFTAPAQKGTYQFLCTEEGHEDEGMVGEMIVR